MKVIGKITALENRPTTIDEFYFWTDSKRILDPFDVVVVDHLNDSKTYGVIEEINHITDTPGYMGAYISNDFGDVNISAPTRRIGMNYIKARVVGNTKSIYIPVRDGSAVRLASKNEVSDALGLSGVKNALPCGYIQMYSYNDDERIQLPVQFNGKFLIGPEGAHLNISGISGLAAKTSYAMFLLKGMQHKMSQTEADRPFGDESVAFVVINVKGRDLLKLDQPPEKDQFSDADAERYRELGIEPTPFENVKYFFPHEQDDFSNSYASREYVDELIQDKKGHRFKYTLEEDLENIDLLFANIEDSTGTMESACNYIQSRQGVFANAGDWDVLEEKITEMGQTKRGGDKEITVQSWRKFKRIISKSLKNKMFGSRVVPEKGEVRLSEALSEIRSNDMFVVDIAKLDENLQSFVFGDVIRTIYDLKLGQLTDSEDEIPTRIVIFIDELNKYAGSDLPKGSPILRQIIDISERGRSLGIVLFSAEQFKSAIHERVKGNCSTHAYGRTNAIEVSKKDYSYIPSVYKNMMVRLSQGEYIVQNPVFTSPLHIRFPKPIYFQEK
ncbi:ATP-binding protein [Desulfogranum marinum]|uniref:ATP-binding protein n=1 Tax=Desulfogranum marinum TaxID=453220 RepID=UPI0019636262|nr:ATP-binding protein [Desulfogranum marinum]MBM9514784.1 ATP-binding protein [Desulfogranum marinum]